MNHAIQRCFRGHRLRQIARRALVVVALTTSAASHADMPEGNWTLVKDEYGIQVFASPMANSDFQGIKATGVLNAPLSSLMAVMNTPDSCMEWVHNCMAASNLEVKSFNERIAYSINDLPWPFTDRDYILTIKTWHDLDSDEIVMSLNATDGVKPAYDNYVRVRHTDTLYRFKAIDATHTRITWIQHTEPNGALPSWLVNTLVIDIPYISMRKLAITALKPRYQGFEIQYDAQGEIIGVTKAAAQ